MSDLVNFVYKGRDIDPFEAVPDEVWNELHYEICRAELEYDDNWRAYRVKDGLCKNAYYKAQKRGCCGFFETYIIDSNGDKWRVGCNYGH